MPQAFALSILVPRRFPVSPYWRPYFYATLVPKPRSLLESSGGNDRVPSHLHGGRQHCGAVMPFKQQLPRLRLK